MSTVPIPFGSNVVRGVFVQLIEDVIGVIPNIIAFQYNPEKVTRGLTPWNPFDSTPANRGTQAPDGQPYSPEEKISFDLQFDASDGIGPLDPLTITTGVAPRIAALKKLTQKTQGLIGDIVGGINALKGKPAMEAERPKIPITLLGFGPGLILPVRVTSFSVDESLHTPLLYPHQAQVSIELQVLTPDLFKCQKGTAVELAISAFQVNQLQEDILALANVVNTAQAIPGFLPF